MIQDIFAWLLATFVIGPVQTELANRMQAAQAPAAIVQQVQSCVVSAAPVLVERAADDVWWGVSTVISVAAGLTDAKTLLAETSPKCASAVSAVRPFLNSPQV